MAALELVADCVADADVPLAAPVEAWVDAGPLPVLTTTTPNR